MPRRVTLDPATPGSGTLSPDSTNSGTLTPKGKGHGHGTPRVGVQPGFIASQTLLYPMTPSSFGQIILNFLASSSAVYTPTPNLLGFFLGFIPSTTVAHPQVLGEAGFFIPFISSTTSVHAPTAAIETFTAPFISSVTATYAPTATNQTFTLSFVSTSTTLYALVLGDHPTLSPGFIPSVTTLYAVPQISQFGIGFIASLSAVYAPSAVNQRVTVGFIATTTTTYALTASFRTVRVPFRPSLTLCFAPTSLLNNQVTLGFITSRTTLSAMVVGGLYNGAGFWRPTFKTYTGAQAVTAVEAGRGAMADEITAANYPNTALRLFYKHAGVANVSPAGTGPTVRDTSATLFTKDDLLANPSWCATTNGSTPMVASAGNGDPGALVADVGSSAYRAASVTEILRFANACVARGETINGIYFDNASAQQSNFMPAYPFGYTHVTWRNAVIAYYAALADALKGAGYYMAANLTDDVDVTLGESNIDFSSGATYRRFWSQIIAYIVANNTHTNALDQLFFEFFCQKSDGTATPRPVGTTDASNFWVEWQSSVAYAHNLNRDFGATATEEGAFLNASYERGSFLLDADLSRHDVLWIWNTTTSSATMTPSVNLYSTPGAPDPSTAGSHSITGSLHWRKFANFTVIVNPTTSSDTQTILGTPRTVAALTAVFV